MSFKTKVRAVRAKHAHLPDMVPAAKPEYALFGWFVIIRG
jgi:hypothetical protein